MDAVGGGEPIDFAESADSTQVDLVPGSPALVVQDALGILTGPNGFEAGASMGVESSDLVPGQTYRFTCARMTLAVPSDFDVAFDIPLTEFRVRGIATKDGFPSPADPGQWVRVVPSPGTAAVLGTGLIAANRRRR